MDDINTARSSNIGRTQTKEQKETLISGNELIVWTNQNSSDEAEFSKEEVDQVVKSVKNSTKLKRFTKLSSKHRLDKIKKIK